MCSSDLASELGLAADLHFELDGDGRLLRYTHAEAAQGLLEDDDLGRLPWAWAGVEIGAVDQQRLQTALDRRARADLVANMSHELRTPVAAARAIAETLQAGVSEPEEAARFHDRLVEEIGRLDAMVDRLRSSTLAGAVCDVFDPEPFPEDSPIRDLPNVFATPHTAAAAQDGRGRNLTIMVEELDRFFAGHETRYDLLPRTIANRTGAEPPKRV